MKTLTALALVAALFVSTGCVGNKAGINSPLYVAPEKRSVAAEIDQGVETAGKVIRFFQKDKK